MSRRDGAEGQSTREAGAAPAVTSSSTAGQRAETSDETQREIRTLSETLQAVEELLQPASIRITHDSACPEECYGTGPHWQHKTEES